MFFHIQKVSNEKKKNNGKLCCFVFFLSFSNEWIFDAAVFGFLQGGGSTRIIHQLKGKPKIQYTTCTHREIMCFLLTTCKRMLRCSDVCPLASKLWSLKWKKLKYVSVFPWGHFTLSVYLFNRFWLRLCVDRTFVFFYAFVWLENC